MIFGGHFDFDLKSDRLIEVTRELENPHVWENPTIATALGRERTELEKIVSTLQFLERDLSDIEGLIVLAQEEQDNETLEALFKEVHALEKKVGQLEFERMFSGKMDPCNAFLDIQAGSGGTEAQDWAAMLLRMYLRWGERRGFKTTLLEVSDGEVAGIKGATIQFEGEYAYGWLRTETGVHRLVRKSPFDSGNRRHTSFTSVFVYPEVEDDIEIEINPADLRIDTYRASGAGGQHVNRTDSAIRITHMPTNVVVQCQSDRSQHKNRANAMKQLRAKLYELEHSKRLTEQKVLEESKSDIGWGAQIRSYVLDQSRVKDLRTNDETSDTEGVLDGNLDPFMLANLKAGF